jgi:hypothetical protein
VAGLNVVAVPPPACPLAAERAALNVTSLANVTVAAIERWLVYGASHPPAMHQRAWLRGYVRVRRHAVTTRNRAL